MKLFFRIVGMLCVLAAARCSYGLETSVPELNVPFVASPPTIDGIVNDSEWKSAAVIPEFVDNVSGKKVSQKTICRIAQDADNLYIAYVCYDDDVSKVVQNIRKHDGPLWEDDSVDLFLDPQGNRKSYYHFIVNPAGAKYEDCGGTVLWDRYWVAKTGKSQNAWTVEMQIPFASLGICRGNPAAKVWLANFFRERKGVDAQLSGWSPTAGPSFLVTAAFGKLNGIKATSPDYCRNGEIFAESPARWWLGNNQVAVTIPNAAPTAYKSAIVCVDLNSGKDIAYKLVDIKPGLQTLKMSIPINTATSYDLQFVIFDGRPSRRVLGSSRAIKVDIASGFKAVLAYPCFRNSFQSHDPKKEICVKGFVGFPRMKGLSVRAVLKSDAGGKSFWEHTVAVAAQSDFTLRKAINLPPPGNYTLSVDLVDAFGARFASASYPIRVLPPAPFEVTFDDRHICYVNGRPFFPIGLYNACTEAMSIINDRSRKMGLPGNLTVDSMLRDVKDHGFNTVTTSWMMPSEEYLTKAQEDGLFVVAMVTTPSATDLSKYVASANKFNNVPDVVWTG